MQEYFKKSQYTPREIIPLQGDASERKYYRFYQGEKSYILTYDPFKARFIAVLDYLQQHQIAVPEIIEDIDPHYFVQEDLGDGTLYSLYLQGMSEEVFQGFYQNALAQIGKLQAIKDYSTPLEFDERRYFYEYNITAYYYLERYLELKDVKIMAQIKKFYEGIIQEILQSRKVLCHRDYHSRNLMVKDQKLFLIDFQDMMNGHPLYDLVSLLEDCYTHIDEKSKEKLKSFFWETSPAVRELFEDRQQFAHHYALIGFQRLFKAMGTFCFQFYERNNPHYLKYFSSTRDKLMCLVRDHEELQEIKGVFLP